MEIKRDRKRLIKESIIVQLKVPKKRLAGERFAQNALVSIYRPQKGKEQAAGAWELAHRPANKCGVLECISGLEKQAGKHIAFG